MAKKKKGRRRHRAKKKSRVKADSNALPVHKQNIRRMVTPLWILSSVAAISAAVAFGFHYKCAALWISYIAIVLGLGSFFAYLHSKIAEQNESPHVSVVSEIWFPMETRDMTIWLYVLDGGIRKTASPINDLIYVRLKNEDSAQTLVVDYFAVEVSKNGKQWRRATLIDYPEGKIYGMPKQPGVYTQFNFVQGMLKEAVFEKNIRPRDTVKGWLLIERPEGFNKFDDCKFWRLLVKNIDHVEAVASIEKMKPEPNKETFGAGILQIVHQDVDLSGVPICFFSERGKLK